MMFLSGFSIIKASWGVTMIAEPLSLLIWMTVISCFLNSLSVFVHRLTVESIGLMIDCFVWFDRRYYRLSGRHEQWFETCLGF